VSIRSRWNQGSLMVADARWRGRRADLCSSASPLFSNRPGRDARLGR
jgi:hypothetical protein